MMRAKSTLTKKKTATGKPASTKRKSGAAGPPGRVQISPQPSPAEAHEPSTSAKRAVTKKAKIETLLRHASGADITELTAATGWQAHSVRAALTGLRKAGHEVSRQRDDGGTARYRLVELG